MSRAQAYIQAGHRWVVDLDLEKFFDRVSHEILISQVAKRVNDKRMLKLIRSFLKACVLENGAGWCHGRRDAPGRSPVTVVIQSDARRSRPGA
ncbi:MAG: hypothetical protein VB135_05430 [Burkholderia sp.]